jgi:hypothetical protein
MKLSRSFSLSPKAGDRSRSAEHRLGLFRTLNTVPSGCSALQ